VKTIGIPNGTFIGQISTYKEKKNPIPMKGYKKEKTYFS